MKYFVYVLKSKIDNKNYYGLTSDLEKRIKDHNTGKVKSTKNRIPLHLVYHETVEGLEKAISKERYFKSGFGRKYVKNKIKKLAPSSSG